MKIKNEPEMIETLAELAHVQWSEWMRYLFSRCIIRESGMVVIPSEWAERWKRQMDAFYNELTEKEKDSDRSEAKLYLSVFCKDAIIEQQ